MHPVAAILDSLILYRYSIVLALAAAAGLCFFMACCSFLQIPSRKAAAAGLASVLLSLFLSRLVYWYGRPDSFTSLAQALLSSSTENFALAGVFGGCALSALLVGGQKSCRKLLDSMCVAACSSLALGRLGCFFTESNRGQVMTKLTSLPWAYPVTNASGYTEYRFATFLFQAAFAALLGIFLAVIFFRKRYREGGITILFVLFYSASQIILDSTRYDSLYLRCNGFVSMVQVLSAVSLVAMLILLSILAIKQYGLKLWLFPICLSLAILLGGAGYMEYYVQRHGREAAFAYSIMGICLTVVALLGFLLWKLSLAKETE